jgi:hypothetical protein
LVLLTWLAGAIGWLPRRHRLLHTASGDDLHQSLSAPSLLFLARPPIRCKLNSSSVFLSFSLFLSFFSVPRNSFRYCCSLCDIWSENADCGLLTCDPVRSGRATFCCLWRTFCLCR